MNDRPLFGPASDVAVTYPVRRMARRTDPHTSILAALDVLPHTANGRMRALVALRAAGERGLTDFELEELTGIKQTSIGKRRLDLMRLGLVVAKEGARRPTSSRSLAQVWIAV